jgi:NADH:ubiquinone oxidoreductase subunit K
LPVGAEGTPGPLPRLPLTMTFGLLVSLAGGAGFLLSGRGLLLKVFCLEVLLLGVAAALAVGLAEAGLAASPVLVAVAAAGAETAVGVSLVVAGHRGAEGRRA